MKHFAAASLMLLAALTLSVVADAPMPKTPANQTTLNGHTFTLPPGFEIELVAGPPLVNRPVTADFDEEGRLYVIDSSGSNEKPTVQLEKKPNRILRLEGTRDDGKFDKATVFADAIPFAEGTLWHAGSLYVAAPPSIWKLTDTKGTGTADLRSEWFQGKTLTGCANDLHGPYLGPDGWIYWCKGAFAKQTYERPGKAPFVTRAAHIFRCKPDGSGIEPVMTGGMDNPVQVVFTPGGERIFTTTFLQHPGGGKRDGLIHAIYGGIYGKDHDVVHEHKWTGPALMPVLTHLGPAAPCGLVHMESGSFGPEYQHNLFATLFNMQKVTRHVLEPSGATFKTRDEDFLVSSNRDFHPTHILEDADGSLLVIDTGGWYKLCCPTSQLVKPDVLGGIYRIRKKDAPKVADPRGRKLDWATLTLGELVNLLGDARPTVRQRAMRSLAAKGAEAVPALDAAMKDIVSAPVRRAVIWTSARIDHDGARRIAHTAARDADETVRQAALYTIGLWRDKRAVPMLLECLKSKSPHNQRAAAEALGRIGDRAAGPALLAVLAEPGQNLDRALEHSLIYALIEIGNRDALVDALKSPVLNVRRAALVAADQMDGGKVEPALVAAELGSKDPAMKETAAWIVGRHSEWGGALAGLFRERLSAKTLSPAEAEELARQLGGLAKNSAIQQMLTERLRDPSTPKPIRLAALRAMARSGLKQTPGPWLEVLAEVVTADDADLVREAVNTSRALPMPKQRPEKLAAGLLTVGTKTGVPAPVRLAALAGVPGNVGELAPALFDFVRANLDREQPVSNRTLAADVLARSKLTSDQLLALTEAIKTTGPMELNRVLDAFAQSSEEKVGITLVAALKAPSAQSALRVERLKPLLAKYGMKLQAPAEELYAAIDADAAKQTARLEAMLRILAPGDARRGQAVFNGTKAGCSSCHAVGYLGGNVGPDLTRIGQIRQERDLLESIVFPSASFTQGFEPVVVTTKDGKVYNGLVRKNASDEVLLVLGANQEVRIARDDIEDMQPSKVSVMPAGLDQQLTQQELADVVAFLKACK